MKLNGRTNNVCTGTINSRTVCKRDRERDGASAAESDKLQNFEKRIFCSLAASMVFVFDALLISSVTKHLDTHTQHTNVLAYKLMRQKCNKRKWATRGTVLCVHFKEPQKHF